MRDREGWNQAELARRCGTSQNAISRHENPEYGKPSLTSLRNIAAAFDVALVVRFAPFGELVDWVAGIPRTISGLSETESLVPPSFAQKQEAERGLAARSSAAAFDDSTWFYRPLETPTLTIRKKPSIIPFPKSDDWFPDGTRTISAYELEGEKVQVAVSGGSR